MREATFFSSLPQKQIRCELCPEFCILSEGQTGSCLVRTHRQGTLKTQIYGEFTAMALEPIEKKPLFHFLPGSRVLSVGSMGCTMNCDYCQNWSVSQKRYPTRFFKAEAVLEEVRLKQADAICFTYNEPLLMVEYLSDVLPLFAEAKVPVILKTSGYINPEPLKTLLPFISAVNLDLKSLDPTFYQRVCHRDLAPVLKVAQLMARTSHLHLEISHLIISEENDQDSFYHPLGSWIQRELGEYVPLHLGVFFPANRFSQKIKTTLIVLERAYEIFRSYLPFTYLSASAYASEAMKSRCPFCQSVLVSRNFRYETEAIHLTAKSTCRQCHQSVPFVLPSL